MNLRIKEKEPINPLPRRRDKPVERIIWKQPRCAAVFVRSRDEENDFDSGGMCCVDRCGVFD